MAMTFEVDCKECVNYKVCIKVLKGKHPQVLTPCWSGKPKK